MAGITVKINNIDRTEYIDARSLSITDELTSRVNSASFIFTTSDKTIAPIAGQTVLIEEGSIKLFSGRILSREESFLPPNLLTYNVSCIDYTRDLDKKLVVESYINQLAGDIIRDILTKYTTSFTFVHVQNGPTLTKIAFDYVQVSQALTTIAETCGYNWFCDYDKDIWFFFKTDYPAPFQLDDNQLHYRDLIINYDVSQLRNRIYVKSSNYEILDFTELFIGDGSTIIWTCKYQANATPTPSLKLNDVSKTVGWDGIDNPNNYNFMLNATTKVLSLGTYQSTPALDDEIVITYGAITPIMVRWDDQVSIDAIKLIEGGDGIFEYCITNNDIDTKEWAIDVAKADLLQNANPVIKGTFTTNKKDIRSGQIITVNSTKRNISQAFLVQTVNLIRVDTVTEYPVYYKPAATATIGYKPAADAVISYKPAGDIAGTEFTYYVYEVTIATHLKGLEDLLLQLLYQSSESLKRDTEAPDVPSGLTLSTGMGSITQASLAWLKATWTANTEADFSHYELKYKKTAYSDFGLVTTTNISFLWTGLEQNIQYEVYIRSVDIYGNRSAWSGSQLITTATDSTVPTQVTGAVAVALLAGIKVNWTRGTGTNVAGYAVERQESTDGVTWTGAWTEIVRTDTTMWLDLLLSYTVYYRYRVKAFTQTGVEGATSTPTANSIKPNKAGTNDIVAYAITADLIAANSITANKYNELRNTYVFNGDDSLDATFPFELDFEIVSEMTAINSVKLSFRISQFRAYSVGAASGGVVTSSAGGAQTSSAGGAQTSAPESATKYVVGAALISAFYSVTNVGTEGVSGKLIQGTPTAELAASNNHTHTVANHTHTVADHTHTGGAHTHGITYGIYEDTQSPTINVYVSNDGTSYGASIGAYTTDQLDINIGGISGTGWKRIKFTSNARARISCILMCKIDLSA